MMYLAEIVRGYLLPNPASASMSIWKGRDHTDLPRDGKRRNPAEKVGRIRAILDANLPD